MFRICENERCIDCNTDEQCISHYDDYYCTARFHSCEKFCNTNYDCEQGSYYDGQVCDPETRKCVECVTSNDCSKNSQKKICNENKCIDCLKDIDCKDNIYPYCSFNRCFVCSAELGICDSSLYNG